MVVAHGLVMAVMQTCHHRTFESLVVVLHGERIVKIFGTQHPDSDSATYRVFGRGLSLAVMSLASLIPYALCTYP